MRILAAQLAFALSMTAATAASSQTTPTPPNEPAHKVFTLIGCLTASPSQATAFKLTDAVSKGQTSPSDSSSVDKSYDLAPKTTLADPGISRDELQGHVGKKVEVIVRPIETPPTPATPSSATATETSKPAPPPSPRYTVTKIDVVAATCS